MRIALESTDQIDELPGGHVARLWRGVSENGVEIRAWIAKIGYSSKIKGPAELEFERALAPLAPMQRELNESKVIREVLEKHW